MLFTSRLKTLVFICLASISSISNADIFEIIESKPINELWLNPGAYSYHLQKNNELNNSNFGFGGEYRYSTVSSVTLGVFDNSDRRTTRYAGWYWQPIKLGPVRLGAVAGIMDGYPRMQNGGWFIVAIPAASFEYQNIGANLIYIPSYREHVYGSISLQLKFKLY